MNTIEKIKKGNEFLNDIYAQCHEDAGFKQSFISNPERAMEEFKNIQLTFPKDKAIQVEDQSDDSVIYLNIPAKPNLDEMELTDEQMESISGGSFWAAVGAGLLACAIYDAADGFIDGLTGN